jgi:hypothetical protein
LRGNISNGVEIGDADARLQLAITHNMERRIRLRRGGRSIFDATIITSYARKVKHIVESGTDGSIKRSRRSFMDRGHGQPLISTRYGGATAAEAACWSIQESGMFLDGSPATWFTQPCSFKFDLDSHKKPWVKNLRFVQQIAVLRPKLPPRLSQVRERHRRW